MGTAISEWLQWAQQSPSTAPSVLASTLLVFAVATVAWLLSFKNSNARKSPPSPWALPVIGNLHQLGRSVHMSLATLASRYGPLMVVRFGSMEYLIVTSADVAREVMKTNDVSFSSRPRLRNCEDLLYGSRDVATNPYGEHWRQARRVFVLHLLTAARLRQFSGIKEGEVAAMLHKVEAGAREGKAVNISMALLDLTSNITSLVSLGKSYWDEEQDEAATQAGKMVKELISEFLKLVGTFNIADFVPSLACVNWLSGHDRRVAKCAKRIVQWLEEEIQQRLQMQMQASGSEAAEGKSGADFVDVLLSLEEAGNQGFSLFDRDTIKALLLDMFAAGTHTTATTMDWTMTELMRHPEVRTKLTKEIRSTCGPDKTLIREDDIEAMPYLQFVIKEILRLHPPFPLLAPRESIEDVELMGYHILKGTKVLINAWAIHRDPKTWDRPNEFLPERFADTTVDYKGFDFQLIPFGSGRRGCPGLVFAMQVAHLAIANLLYNYDWELPEGINPESLDMAEATGITTQRNYSLSLKAKKDTVAAA